MRTAFRLAKILVTMTLTLLEWTVAALLGAARALWHLGHLGLGAVRLARRLDAEGRLACTACGSPFPRELASECRGCGFRYWADVPFAACPNCGSATEFLTCEHCGFSSHGTLIGREVPE